jgi:ArsR family transcriptional regulator
MYIIDMKNTVQYLRALADETRLRIMALLLVSGELCVCDITATLQLPQSTVSRHLSYLKNAGWVNDRRKGVWIFYTVAADNSMKQQLADVLKERLPELNPVTEDIKRLSSFTEDARCA